MSENRGLPSPFIEHVPELYRQQPDESMVALADKMDDLLAQALVDVLGLYDLKDPASCPAALLEELGDMLAAGLQAYDDERTRRLKIAVAVQGHKRRGSWADDAKAKVDAVTGGDSSIFRGYESDDAIEVGDGVLEAPTNYWSAEGCDGVDLHLGIAEIGAGTEVEVAGNIYIDIGRDRFPNLVRDPEDLTQATWVPAYCLPALLDEVWMGCKFTKLEKLSGGAAVIRQVVSGITISNPSVQAVFRQGQGPYVAVRLYDNTIGASRGQITVDWGALTVTASAGLTDLSYTWIDPVTVWVSGRFAGVVPAYVNNLEVYPYQVVGDYQKVTAIKMENGPATAYAQDFSPAKIQQIIDALQDVAPAYMWVHLGYVNGAQFIEYTVF